MHDFRTVVSSGVCRVRCQSGFLALPSLFLCESECPSWRFVASGVHCLEGCIQGKKNSRRHLFGTQRAERDVRCADCRVVRGLSCVLSKSIDRVIRAFVCSHWLPRCFGCDIDRFGRFFSVVVCAIDASVRFTAPHWLPCSIDRFFALSVGATIAMDSFVVFALSVGADDRSSRR